MDGWEPRTPRGALESPATGRMMRTVVPTFTSDSTSIEPPCRWMIAWQVGSPSPRPVRLPRRLIRRSRWWPEDSGLPSASRSRSAADVRRNSRSRIGVRTRRGGDPLPGSRHNWRRRRILSSWLCTLRDLAVALPDEGLARERRRRKGPDLVESDCLRRGLRPGSCPMVGMRAGEVSAPWNEVRRARDDQAMG